MSVITAKLRFLVVSPASTQLLLFVLGAPTSLAAEQFEGITRVETSPQSIVETLVTALNNGAIDAATALFDGTAVIRLSDGRTFTGSDQIRNLWQVSAEKLPAKIEIQDLLAFGEHVGFKAKVKSSNREIASKIEAVVRSGRIYLYTVTNEAEKSVASMISDLGSQIGVVQSVRQDRIYRQTAETRLVAKGMTATTSGQLGGSPSSNYIRMAQPSVVVPMYEIIVKLKDGSSISVTQAETFKTGDRVRLVSISGKIQLLPADAVSNDGSRSNAAEFLPIEVRSRDQSSKFEPKPFLPPQGVFYASWDQYQGFPTVLMPASQGICFLQGVTGNYRGAGEGVWVRNNGTNWELNGISQQNNVSARAMCVPFSAIQGANQGFNYMIGTAFISVYYGGCSWWETCHGNNGFLDLWGLDSFCYLTGMGGAFNGGGEIVSVNAWAPDHWYMLVYTQVEGATNKGEAGCMAAIGHPRPRTTDVVRRYHWSQGQPFQQLPNSDQAFCALNWITGHFAGWGETVEIYHNPDNTQWLGGSSYQQDVGAYVSCMYYDQRL